MLYGSTWEHMGVMAGAVKMLDVGGIWAEKTQLGRLNFFDFAVRCPIEANQVVNGSPSPTYISVFK
jgi:hypothetical protein